MKPRGKVFIAYRREGGAEMARLVRDGLRERGHDVFMDVEDLRSGPFNTELFRQIESCTDVVVVLTPNSLNRCSSQDDWLRLEVAHAIKCKKNLVPVRTRGLQWPPDALPDDIKELPHLQGIEPSHDYFNASMDKLASLLVGMPKTQSNRRVWIAVFLVAAILIAVIMPQIASLLSLGSGALRFSGSIQSAIKEAIDAVDVKEETVRFTGYEDRDSNGFMYMAMIGAPERMSIVDVNSRQVWQVHLRHLKGREIESLLALISQAETSDREKCKALFLLANSAIENKDPRRADRIISVIAERIGKGMGAPVQEASLSLIEACPGDPRVKWSLLSPTLSTVPDDSLGGICRKIWKWVPLEQRNSTCQEWLGIFARTRSEWTACDIAYAIRKMSSIDILPIIRKELSLTLTSRKALYLARLVIDFEDRDAVPSLRAAFSRHCKDTRDGKEIAEILFHIEGEPALPFIVTTSLREAPSLIDDLAESYRIGKERILKELNAVIETGKADERLAAEAALTRLQAKKSK